MSDVNKLFVSEYLENLRESKELDYIFAIMLEMMGFRLLSTPQSSRGQSQYGKDIVAIKEDDGLMRTYYFIIKGGSDKNITDNVLTKNDGVIPSMRAAKYTRYRDSTIPNFDSWPVKYVLVHNGVLVDNAKPTWEGFLQSDFNGLDVERWDLTILSDLFYKNLFNEYVLAEGTESISLFKKTLVLLDVPEYDLAHFFKLIDLLCTNAESSNPRVQQKFLTSLSLISVIIFHYCKTANNIERAKICSSYVVLRAWHWILLRQKTGTRDIQRTFNDVLLTHLMILAEYFGKTIPVATLPHGLFLEQGGNFEEIGYPMRSMDYLNFITYFFRLKKAFLPKSDPDNDIDILKEIINANLNGISRPQLDNHGIAYISVFKFILDFGDTPENREFLKGLLNAILESICITKTIRDRFPELYNNENALVEYVTSRKRPYNYSDSSSTLVLILFELAAILDSSDTYDRYRQFFITNEIDLQTYYFEGDEGTELSLFTKELKSEGYSETGITLPESFEDFKTQTKAKFKASFTTTTDKVDLGLIRNLAHLYFKTPFHPNDWRIFMNN